VVDFSPLYKSRESATTVNKAGELRSQIAIDLGTRNTSVVVPAIHFRSEARHSSTQTACFLDDDAALRRVSGETPADMWRVVVFPIPWKVANDISPLSTLSLVGAGIQNRPTWQNSSAYVSWHNQCRFAFAVEQSCAERTQKRPVTALTA
jgi:hypothetical protein